MEVNPMSPENPDNQSILQTQMQLVRAETGKVLVGQEEVIELLLSALYTGGHVLIEGVPGIAKTLTAKLLARTLSVGFTRIQFTPDLMPADILGSMVFNVKESEFRFNKGPVFSNLVLIDEINRAPAKTQAALFEVMEEKQITIDGVTYPMENPFMVIATQNPIEQEGTYRLPEAQLDRFLFRIRTTYPTLDQERTILQRFKNDFSMKAVASVSPVLTPKQIMEGAAAAEQVMVHDDLIAYIAEIIHASRSHPGLFLGASPRASIAVMKAAKALAAMYGRDFITPDDIRFILPHVLNHRVILAPELELEGANPEEVIKQLIEKVEVPR